MPDFQRTGRDITKRNPNEFVYLKGDADTDGSLRLVPDSGTDLNFEFQLYSNNVWNDTGIQIAGSTIHLANENFAYKRTNLSESVIGSGSEGVIIRLTQGGNNAIRYASAHIGVLI